MAAPILLPGDVVPTSYLPTSNNALKLSSGLLVTSNTSSPSIKATHAGPLLTSTKKKTATTTLNLSRPSNALYQPQLGDLVIAQIKTSGGESFQAWLQPFTPTVQLGHLSFENASKKTRPQLKPRDLVFAVVSAVPPAGNGEVEISCVHPATGKAQPGGLGPITTGTIVRVRPGFAERLMTRNTSVNAGVVVLEELGSKVETANGSGFEIAIGKNGVVWVDVVVPKDLKAELKAALKTRLLIAVTRCLKATDEEDLDISAQRKLVSKVLKELRILE